MYTQVGTLASVAEQSNPSHHILANQRRSLIAKNVLTFSCSQPSPCWKQPPLSQPKGLPAPEKVQLLCLCIQYRQPYPCKCSWWGRWCLLHYCWLLLGLYQCNQHKELKLWQILTMYFLQQSQTHIQQFCPDFVSCKHYTQFKLFLKRQSTSMATINHTSIQLTENTHYSHANPSCHNEIAPAEDFHQGWV